MKVIIEKNKRREIIADFTNDSLTIKGDCAPTSILIYQVLNRYNLRSYGQYLTRAAADEMCDLLHKKENVRNVYFSDSIVLFCR